MIPICYCSVIILYIVLYRKNLYYLRDSCINTKLIKMYNLRFQVFLGWANSVLCEAGLLLDGLDDLQSGVALATIVDTLWPDAQLSAKVLYSEQVRHNAKCCVRGKGNIRIGTLIIFTIKRGFLYYYTYEEIQWISL